MPIADPTTLLLVLIATASASCAHLIWGRRWIQLLIFWLAAFLGCLLVYSLHITLPLNLRQPAGVPVLESFLAAWFLLIVASRVRI